MLKNNDDLMVYITTLKREGNQITAKWIPDRWKDRVVLFCPSWEEHDYPNRVDAPESVIGNLSKTRQYLVENSPSRYIGLLDDDLSFYERGPVQLTKRHKMQDMGDYLDLMEKWLKEGDVYCTISNPFMCHTNPEEYYYGKSSWTHFMDTNYMLTHDIRFDVIRCYSDFHVPLAVLESGHRLRITGKYIASEKKANAPGGCSTYRTAEMNRNSVFKLRELHPKYVTVKDCPGATNQTLVIDVKMRIAFKKAYDENVVNKPVGNSLDVFM